MQHVINELWIYPIKSLGGVQLQSAMALTEGLQYDRRWMLIDKNGKFITQREHHILATYTCKMDKDNIIVNNKTSSISIPLEQQQDNIISVTVWDSALDTHEVDTKISQWFSDQLSQEVRLVRMTDASHRPKTLKTEPYTTQVSLADGYPYLIIGEQSMRTLNEKLDAPIGHLRFRANIIISSEVAHEEDNLDTIKVGQAELKVIKPCARCVVITIDDTGKAGKEPTKTLASYRKDGNKINFGANTICMKEGEIRVGDILIINY